MKTIQGFFNLLLFFLGAGFFFAGCYTRMETMNDEGSGGRDSGDYAYSDSTDTSSDTTGNNYFSDDGYRSSQYRMAFDYYSPSPYVWGTNAWCDPWYGDYGYLWDPMLAYPYPYWYGNYPYYGWGYGFGFYYNAGYRRGRGGTGFAGRLRTTGSTRGGDGFMRTRNGAGVSAPNPAARGVASSRTRTPAVPEAAAPNTSRTRSREEVPWWERTKTTTGNSPGRSRVAARTQSAGGNASVVYQKRNTGNPSKSGVNARQVYQHRGRMQPRSAGPQSGQTARQASPRNSSPQRASGRSGSSGGASRSGGGGSRGGGAGSRGK